MPQILPNRNTAPRTILGLALCALALWQAPARAQSTYQSTPGSAGLPELLQMAAQKQPRLAVHRASLASAEDAARALDQLRFAAIIDPEITVRRRQACIGISASAAGLAQAERETAYAVTISYFTVLYAVQQEALAIEVVDRLRTIRDAAKNQLAGGAKGVTTSDVHRTNIALGRAETKRTEATVGIKRALAALREAIGLDCDVAIQGNVKLPEYAVRLSLEEVVHHAVTHRGDLIRASLFAEVACLEIEAQGCSLGNKKETFAAGNDIHSVLVPQGSNYPEIKPGALAPEMPTILVGCRSERMKHAQSLHCRALALVDTARNLIILEANEAFRQWEQTTLQVEQMKETAKEADLLRDEIDADYLAKLNVKIDDRVNAFVQAAQIRAELNQTLYKQIVALADLERVTAGGFTLPWNPVQVAPAEKAK